MAAHNAPAPLTASDQGLATHGAALSVPTQAPQSGNAASTPSTAAGTPTKDAGLPSEGKGSSTPEWRIRVVVCTYKDFWNYDVCNKIAVDVQHFAEHKFRAVGMCAIGPNSVHIYQSETPLSRAAAASAFKPPGGAHYARV
jgi:hypothetical protein